MKRNKRHTSYAIIGCVFFSLFTFADHAVAVDSHVEVGLKPSLAITPPVNPIDPNIPIFPVDPLDPTNKGTGEHGPLSIDFASNLDFGTQAISSKTMTYFVQNQHPFVQVSDKRGTDDGWRLTASVSTFKSTDNQSILRGAELSMLNAQVKSVSDNVSSAPLASQKIVFTNQESQPILHSPANSGNGTWLSVWSGVINENKQIQLKIIGNSAKPKQYVATINWTLISDPLT